MTALKSLNLLLKISWQSFLFIFFLIYWIFFHLFCLLFFFFLYFSLIFLALLILNCSPSADPKWLFDRCLICPLTVALCLSGCL